MFYAQMSTFSLSLSLTHSLSLSPSLSLPLSLLFFTPSLPPSPQHSRARAHAHKKKQVQNTAPSRIDRDHEEIPGLRSFSRQSPGRYHVNNHFNNPRVLSMFYSLPPCLPRASSVTVVLAPPGIRFSSLSPLLSRLQALQPDLCITAAYGQVISPYTPSSRVCP